jgi:hypothetical protein
MNHTNVVDLTLNIRAPNGTSVNMISAAGGTNNDILTVFDDFADSLTSASLTPFSMRVRPTNPLSGLPQTSQNGYWRFSVTDNAANADSGRVYMWGIKFIPFVSVQSNNNNIPDKFALFQNYPNPFNPITNLKFQMPRPGFAELKIFDILGREIAALVNEKLGAGTHQVNWDAASYPSGIYFYRLIAGDFNESKKMMLIK